LSAWWKSPHSIAGIETTRQFEGRYHVLHGALSPLRGIGPDALKIRGLVERIGQGEIKEAIIATNPTVEGEATAVYLARLLKPLGVKVTRIAWIPSFAFQPRRRTSSSWDSRRPSRRALPSNARKYSAGRARRGCRAIPR
jgi:hypothetical protein